jgi:hypothetical protein
VIFIIPFIPVHSAFRDFFNKDEGDERDEKASHPYVSGTLIMTAKKGDPPCSSLIQTKEI